MKTIEVETKSYENEKNLRLGKNISIKIIYKSKFFTTQEGGSILIFKFT